MSYYAQNPHYLPVTYHEDEARFASCESEATGYFDRATEIQYAVYRETLRDLQGLQAPLYDRRREAAKQLFVDTTREASQLYIKTLSELLADGEVSETTSFLWDDLKARTERASRQEAA